MHTAASKDLITQWLNLKWDYKFYQIGKKKKSLHGNSQENQIALQCISANNISPSRN